MLGTTAAAGGQRSQVWRAGGVRFSLLAACYSPSGLKHMWAEAAIPEVRQRCFASRQKPPERLKVSLREAVQSNAAGIDVLVGGGGQRH